MQRTTRGYAIEGEDDHGYYVSPAVGAEVGYQRFGVKVEIAPVAIKAWRLGAKDLLLRVRYGPLSLTAAHVTPSADQRASGAGDEWGAVASLRVVGPLVVSGGWDLLPGDTHRNALRPTAFAGIGVQVDGGAR